MFQINFKKIALPGLLILFIFLIDRLSKNYILKLAEVESSVNIYLTQYLNLYLIWNKGIAFGLLSIDVNFIYNLISLLIATVTIIILIMAIKAKGIKKYSLITVFSGSIGNLYDRVYYSAVPDFIDFHVNNFHWFIFNVADIFISIGVICLIYVEIFLNNGKNDEK
jgi:signal peptidase II|tara:strand:- start:4272 stop:4769 length:498 start_codon:yes stop_codon:yes gene_type:complete